MWLYGCLSSDTEILTNNGWKNSETISNNDFIYSLDLQKNNLIKNQVKNVFKYDYNGEMINLKNNNTNQLLTPNHHCIIKDNIRTRIKGKTSYNSYDYWYYMDAWKIRSQRIELPLASNYNGTLEIGNLFAELLGWVISEGTYLKDTNAIMITQSSVNIKYVNRIRYILGKLNIKYSEYSREREYKDRKYIEYDFYLGKESENVVNKIKELCPNKKLTWKLLELSLSNKEFLIKGLLQGDGTKDDNSLGFSAYNQKDIEQLKIFQVLLHLTNKQGWINENKHCCSIHNNSKTELQGKHFKDRIVNYNGYVWCIETEKGNFIAKRDGKIFITGNSGFPKSENIGLMIDKKNDIKSKVVGISDKSAPDLRDVGHKQKEISGIDKLSFGQIENAKRKFTEIKEAKNKWNGYGSCLKPSFEPIIVARKPFKGSLVDNVLTYGVGGLNIDECRVKTTDDLYREPCKNGSIYSQKEIKYTTGTVNDNYKLGRFPANTILTYDDNDFDEVCGGFPDTNGGKYKKPNARKRNNGLGLGSKYERIGTSNAPDNYGDSGSASRYFYNAKASKKDRDEGLDEFEDDSLDKQIPIRKNIHPTVKPTQLMQYLIRLVTPNNGTILDPFNGSGSTGKAVMYENKERNKNYKYIGIEMTNEYLPISKARIEYVYNLKEDKQISFENINNKEE